MKYLFAVLGLSIFISPARADSTFECAHLDLQGTRLRVNPSIKEPFSKFQRKTAGYRFIVKDSGAVEIWHSMPHEQWKSTPNLTVSPIDPISGTATIMDNRDPELFSYFFLETRGPEIAVMAVTVERSVGSVGTSSAVMTQTGVCKKI